MAKFLILTLWCILVGTAQAETAPYPEMSEDALPRRQPAPAQKISSGDEWAPPAADEPQAISNQGIAVRPDPQETTPPKPLNCNAAEKTAVHPIGDEVFDDSNPSSDKPLPIPPPPPKLDEMVTPVAYQESDSSRNTQPSGRDSASSAKPPAANA